MNAPEPKRESSGDTCRQCGGSGTDPHTDQQCRRCDGSGYEPAKQLPVPVKS
jgi:DnaJ-class molecular chaperone